MGTLAVNEELHAKQQEAARKEAERAARRRRRTRLRMRRAKPGNQRLTGSTARSSPPPGVDPQSAAERAGLKPGDLMTELDGTPARDAVDLRLVTRSWYSCVDPPYGFE